MSVKRFPVLYKRTSSGGVQEWYIYVQSDSHDSEADMITLYGLQGGKVQEIRENITSGKNIGKKNETTPYEQAVLEAEARWTKQKTRKGYGTDSDGEESALIRSSSPMLAHVFEKHVAKVNWDAAVAQPKYNGFRCLVRRVDGKLRGFSREGKPLDRIEHIFAALENVMDAHTTLDGELYKHGWPLNIIASACKKQSSLTEQLVYHVYDTIASEQYMERYEKIHRICAVAGNPSIQVVQSVKVSSKDELMLAQAEFIGNGFEGAMLRHSRVGYEAGKRSAYLLKVKTFVDGEFIVADYKMGRGKYADTPIYTCVTPAGHDFDVLAPGNLQEKKELGDDAANCVGKTLKVKYLEYTKTEEPVPFHPVAICFLEVE